MISRALAGKPATTLSRQSPPPKITSAASLESWDGWLLQARTPPRHPTAPAMHDPPSQRAARFVWATLALSVVTAAIPPAAAGTLEEGFEGAGVTWRLATVGPSLRLVTHGRSPDQPHRGAGCERFVVAAASAGTVAFEAQIGPAAVIEEFQASVWVKATRPDVRVAVRVVLPEQISKRTGKPVDVLVVGDSSRDVGRWERLTVGGVSRLLEQQLPALRLEHGAHVSLAGAVVTMLVLDMAIPPGDQSLAIDDLFVTGLVSQKTTHDPLVQTASAASDVSDPPAGMARGVLEVDGRPFFPRSIDWNGEPFEFLADLGFNCVRLPAPAAADQLAQARAAGLWIICPPPPLPDVDLREPDQVPMLRNWDRVLAWDLGTGLSEESVTDLAELGRRLRASDPRAGRPLMGSADSGLRAVSRHVDIVVARRTVLGTSLELLDWLEWLRQRPRLARPGTPFMTTLATELDPAAARQAAALAGVGGRGLAIDPESLLLATFSAVAGGMRGILYTSSRRLDGDDSESRLRATAVREANLRLRLIEAWGAAGRFDTKVRTSNPEVQAFVIEAGQARIVLAWRCVQGSQVVARRYDGHDIPGEDKPLSILVPGVPEAHRAWEVATGGLRPIQQSRVTGGVSVTLDAFLTHGIVLLSGEPTVTAYLQEQLRLTAPIEIASARSLAAGGLASAGELLGKLPQSAFSGPPPVVAVPMLTEANRLAAEGEALVASDPIRGVARLRKAAAIAGQFERRIWENAVKAEGSLVASPLVASDATLAEAWQFISARMATANGTELLAGGDMEQLEALSGGGWKHYARTDPEIVTAVEVIHPQPAAGRGCLRLAARPTDPKEKPVVLETPPVWITTPPVPAPVGKLLEISARVWVPSAIAGSVDGLFVFDSLGGPALGERVGTSPSWRRMVLYRIVPPELAGEPVVVTFALSGLGEARIDDVSIRVLERSATGMPATLVSTPSQGKVAGGNPAFPGPGELLQPRPSVPTPLPGVRPTPPPTAWPGTSLGWPNLFGGSSNEPPPGIGGGTIDPFTRARNQAPTSP